MYQIDALHSFDPLWILKKIYELIVSGPNSFLAKLSLLTDNLPFYLINFFAKYAVLSLFFSVALIVLVVVYALRVRKIREEMLAKIIPEDKATVGEEKAMPENPKWQLVLKHSDSTNASDWKLAILEADIMLGELLDKLSLPGESIGEKLKAVEKSDFTSIDLAWEGHKIRNAIAHEGSDFLINQREAKRVVDLYKQVFDEFEMI